MQTLKGRTCVFSGATGGDGIAAVRAMCDAGMNVVMMSHFAERAQVLADEINASGCPGICAVLACKPEEGAMEASDTAYQSVVEQFGSVDVMICNTGANGFADDIETTPAADFMKVVEHLARGNYEMIQAALPYLKQSICPRVILMTTVEGCFGGTYESLSNAVGKGAVRALTLNCAARLARYGITVNCISKGNIARIEGAFPGEPPLEARENKIPLGRVGTPEDLAAAICFLASEESGYITGQIIEVSGGLQLGR